MLRRHAKLDFAGSIHFVTTVTGKRGNWFVTIDRCRCVLEVFEYYRAKFEVDCYGYVLMPDHLHALLAQAGDGMRVPKLMENFKRLVTRKIDIPEFSDGTLWREHYDDVPVPGPNAARTKLEYMLGNPVRRGIVSNPTDYQWSSAREHIGLGRGLVTVTDFS